MLKEPYLATPGTDSCWQIKRGYGITLRFRDYTIDRLGVMTQKAEKMLLKTLNYWLCNVQLFPKVWILEISLKAFRISGCVSGSRLHAVLDIRIQLQTHFPAGYPIGKPDSDHLLSFVASSTWNVLWLWNTNKERLQKQVQKTTWKLAEYLIK